MEKPYIKKLETVGEFDVWEVDGMYIRNEINREFTNFGQHFRFPFIPKHEFWIDRKQSEEETGYFVDHMLVEWNLMNEGKSYDNAIAKADQKELKERKKSDLMQKIRKKLQEAEKQLPKELYVRKLRETKSPEIWLVNGELVRDLFFIDFTEGGHHFVYNFVPYNEIWLDNDLVPAERDFVLLHELHERYLMFKGWKYNHAHNSSSYIEYKCRHRPSSLKKHVAEELEKNSEIKVEQVTTIFN